MEEWVARRALPALPTTLLRGIRDHAHSLEAIKAYLEGETQADTGNYRRSAQALLVAIAVEAPPEEGLESLDTWIRWNGGS